MNDNHSSASLSSTYDRQHHNMEIIQHNYELILDKFNQLQNELGLIINSYESKSPRDSTSEINGVDEDRKHRKVYRNGMREIEKTFEITFDENDQISYNDICKIIEFVKHSNERIAKQPGQIENDKIIKQLKNMMDLNYMKNY